ncbi:MAG: multicopper oxidase domain-containing protein [Flavobacteriales bacterium]|nr:multicopper oxidase domain-containing protein [Flavobacteriales bacterium]MCB0785121.1 multicopper oxidase domain-containing protein [Flavobacteriales bacterium]MCB0788640.1 multicopper oxidase domain-containing protein [Flavobacteriales bacterium]MCB0808516.1 multicopper oxidase domain-containing protein [Flavobacteriales bacterium]MCB0813832.1 multicopper oxidase domain-containing protein [Flavobacteriales bacterium]
MAIPPLLDEDTFNLTVGEHQHQFYPGVITTTYGVNGPYLGPTLILRQGDTAHFRVTNQLPQVTNMHWHGMHVPGTVDGGPPREILPGAVWDLKYHVENPAGTYWYHPHPHMITGTQATKGIAGMMIVQDAEEAALSLPRTYGVDDFPIVIQDRRFNSSGEFIIGPYGDSVLVNGTPNAYLECPAQVVRLRLLNGANSRVFRIGFDDGRTFQVVAGDGGLLNTPVNVDRIALSNGERAEVLMDLTGLEGDSLLMLSFGTELPPTVPGSNNILWESSSLNGIDFPVLRIRVTAPTVSPVTLIPSSLGSGQPIPETQATRTRVKTLTGNGMVGMGMFMIAGQMFDLNVVNDTVQVGTTEIWTFQNNSNMAHPMHIHGCSFFILDRNGVQPSNEEAGAKDVVLVDVGETVRVIAEFNHRTEGWPYMYHCHNLMHEDNMMMLQFIVVDQPAGSMEYHMENVTVYPNPSGGLVLFRTGHPVCEVQVFDELGRMVHRQPMDYIGGEGSVDLHQLPAGVYLLEFRNKEELSRTYLIRN